MKSYNSSDFGHLPKLFQRFIPVFILAAFLPFLIGFLISPPKVSFFTSADSSQELRVWLEPAKLIMSPGSEATLTVFGSFDEDNKLIPEISLYVRGDNFVEVTNPLLVHSIPFSGRMELGKVTVKATNTGNAVITIPEDSIEITAFNEDLDINTGSANIVVQ